jgi:hypothetical protein
VLVGPSLGHWFERSGRHIKFRPLLVDRYASFAAAPFVGIATTTSMPAGSQSKDAREGSLAMAQKWTVGKEDKPRLELVYDEPARIPSEVWSMVGLIGAILLFVPPHSVPWSGFLVFGIVIALLLSYRAEDDSWPGSV